MASVTGASAPCCGRSDTISASGRLDPAYTGPPHVPTGSVSRPCSSGVDATDAPPPAATAVQIPDEETDTACGALPTGNVVTSSVDASTRATRPSTALATHTAP